MARSARQLRSPYDLLQSLRSLAAVWCLGPDYGCVGCRSRRCGADDRYVYRPRAQHSACIANNAGQLTGRSRGGLTSKIHVVVDGNGLPVQLGLTAGQAHDNRLCSVLLRYLPRRARLLADRGYDADWIRAFVTERGAWANIPPKRNRKDPICFSSYLYRDRNLIERFFNKIKQCRRVATRYDKLAANYLAFVKLACIRLWLRVYECTA